MKKGFTLVELLMVISLMAALIAIAVPSGIAISKKIKNNMLEEKIEIIESGAIVYGQNNKSKINNSTDTCSIDGTDYKCKKITVKELIDNNYLESDSNDNISLKNSFNDKEMKYNYVYVYIMNKRVYSKFSYELYYNIIADDNIESGHLHSSSFKIKIEGPGIITYSWDGLNYKDDYESNNGISVTSAEHNKTLYVNIRKEEKVWEGTYLVKFDMSATQIDFRIAYNQSNALAELELNVSDDNTIIEYKFPTDINCSGNWIPANQTSLTVPYNFNNISEQNKNYYACIKLDSGEILTPSIFIPNCKVDVTYRCDERNDGSISKKSTYTYSFYSSNIKALYADIDIEGEYFKCTLNSNGETECITERGGSCDGETPVFIHFDSSYPLHEHCYATTISKTN